MSSDEEEINVLQWKGKPATIILINVFDISSYNTAQRAHAVTCEMMRQYLRANSDQLVGVCLFGIEKSNTSILETMNVIDIIPLAAPTLENFKKLKNFDIQSVTPSKELILSDVLCHCQSLFANLKKQVSTFNVILLSRFDIPPIKADEERTLNRVGKMVDIDINLTIINMSENEYKVHSFYNDFLVEAKRQKDIIFPEPLWDLKDIESLIIHHSNRHTEIAKLNFLIGSDVSISVELNTYLKSYESTRLKKYKVDKETHAIVKTFNQMVKVSNDNEDSEDEMDVEETKMPLLKSELLHSKFFGGKKISFTDDEMKMIENPFGPPMIKLLGFKPLHFMSREKWFLKSGNFLYPNEKKMEGSTVAFKAFYKACIDTGVVAICILIKKVNCKPQLVALLPCSYPFNLNVEIGFDVIPIPFKETVKDVPVPEEQDEVPTDTNHKAFLKSLIADLMFNYQPNMFENPVLQCQYRALESKKLGDEVDPFKDSTKPDSTKFEDLREDLFYEYFGPFGPVAAKRGVSTTTLNSKKSKMEGYDENFVQDMIKQKKVDTFTKPQLLEILTHHEVNKATKNLKKGDMVELVYKHCSRP